MIPPRVDLRDRNIRATIAVLNGATFAATGRDIGVSTERVRQICAITSRAVRNAFRDEDLPGTRGIGGMRKHKDHWIRLLNKLAKQWRKLKLTGEL